MASLGKMGSKQIKRKRGSIMQKQVNKIVTVCDVCGKEQLYSTKCRICGKDFCHGCCKDNIKCYPHSICCSGGSDGYYCVECLNKPIPAEHMELIEAYKMIASLRAEYMVWNKNYEARSKAAEAKVQELSKV